jgi:hypothetical protein
VQHALHGLILEERRHRLGQLQASLLERPERERRRVEVSLEAAVAVERPELRRRQRTARLLNNARNQRQAAAERALGGEREPL